MDDTRVESGEAKHLRRACEQCRRKKTRCPAERPTCSFCQRLNQPCTYYERHRSSGKRGRRKPAKRSNSDEREHSFGNHVRDRLDAASQVQQQQGPERCSNESSLLITRDGNPSSWSHDEPEPSTEALDHFVQVYKTNIYFQPLPLFSFENSRKRIEKFPQFLRWSFCALCLHYSSHHQFQGKELHAIDFYVTSAQDAVNKLIMMGTTKVEVLQASCILALCDVFAKSPRAWINVGNATRLETFRRLAVLDSPNPGREEAESAMCYWNVRVLETVFSPQFTVLSQTPDPPEFPQEAPLPFPVHTSERRNYDLDLMNVDDTDNTIRGISTQCLHAISVWGHTTSYLHKVRSGKLEKPWLSSSTFSQLSIELYELESQLSRSHFFRNVSFSNRSTAELNEHCEYWRPWVLMQLTSHAARGLLNHPFIHLVALRDKSVSQPHLFLQQTVDQALYHSGWVVRLVETCERLGFEFHDPLIGNLVAAIATIPWFFQFVRDQKVSKAAAENFGKCERCLVRLARIWPHIGDIVSLLQDLQNVASHQQAQNADNNTAGITFQPALVWKLVDSNMARIGVLKPASSATYQAPSATVRVTTQFIHPVSEDQDAEAEPTSINSFTEEGADGLEYLSLDDYFLDSMTADLPWLPSYSGIGSFGSIQ